jgi:hypothetical protein
MMSAYGTKRNFLHRECPLSGVKRTCAFALHMSAYDPKRTFSTGDKGSEAGYRNANFRQPE